MKCRKTEGFGNILEYFQKQNFVKNPTDVPSENLESTAQLGFIEVKASKEALSESVMKLIEWRPGLNQIKLAGRIKQDLG